MNSFGDEKRKNDDPRRTFPWRTALLLVIGFTLGVVVTLLFVPGSSPATVYLSGEDFARSEISAVQPVPDNAQTDPIYITATYIIYQATATAEADRAATQQALAPLENQDQAIYATATYVVEQATVIAQDQLTATAGS